MYQLSCVLRSYSRCQATNDLVIRAGFSAHMPLHQLLVREHMGSSSVLRLKRLTIPSAALWCLDFVHTMSAELNWLASRRFTGTLTLYLLNRYTFFGYIKGQIVLIVPGTMPDTTYVEGSRFHCQIGTYQPFVRCISLGLTTVLLQLVSVVTTNGKSIIMSHLPR